MELALKDCSVDSIADRVHRDPDPAGLLFATQVTAAFIKFYPAKLARLRCLGEFLGILDAPLADGAVMAAKEVRDGSHAQAFEIKLESFLFIEGGLARTSLLKAAAAVQVRWRCFSALQTRFERLLNSRAFTVQDSWPNSISTIQQ